MANQKKRDDEKGFLIVGAGIFTLALIYIDFKYSDWHLLFSGWFVLAGILAIVLHIVIALAWYICLCRLDDPGYDYVRKWLIGFLIFACATVGLVKAASNEFKSVLDDAKQESTR